MKLAENGLLPEGIHDMDLGEVRDLFGKFQSTDRRPMLFDKLKTFIEAAREVGFVRFVIVDGSFVTSKPDPGDIDLIVVIDPAILNKSDYRPIEYNILSSRRIKRMYSFDVYVVPFGHAAYDEYLGLFEKVKDDLSARKGVVRVTI